jgi:hypothetical protein
MVAACVDGQAISLILYHLFRGQIDELYLPKRPLFVARRDQAVVRLYLSRYHRTKAGTTKRRENH